MRFFTTVIVAVSLAVASGRKHHAGLRGQDVLAAYEQIPGLAPQCAVKGPETWIGFTTGALWKSGVHAVQASPSTVDPVNAPFQYIINPVISGTSLILNTLNSANTQWQVPIQGVSMDGLAKQGVKSAARVVGNVVKLGAAAYTPITGVSFRKFPMSCPTSGPIPVNSFVSPAQLAASFRNGCVAILDPGYPYIGLPAQTAMAVNQALAIDPLCKGVEELPDLIVNFGIPGAPSVAGGSVRISSKAYVRRTSATTTAPVAAGTTASLFSTLINAITKPTVVKESCASAIRPSDVASPYGPAIVLGKPFFSEVNAVFSLTPTRTVSLNTDSRTQCSP